MDMVLNKVPVVLLEDGGDMFSGAGACEKAGSGVLNVLQFLKMSGGKSIKNTISVIESGSDEGVDEYFSCRRGEGGTEASDIAEVEEACSSDMVDVCLI